jgi:hypothetical protein
MPPNDITLTQAANAERQRHITAIDDCFGRLLDAPDETGHAEPSRRWNRALIGASPAAFKRP